MTKVFVGNFSFSVDDAALRDHFAKVGTVVSAKVMTEGQGGRSRGFGFVEFASEEEAKAAIEQLDGGVWDGRVVKVSEDRGVRREGGDREEGGGYSRRNDRDHGDRDSSSAPMGYFRAQPFDVGIKRRKKTDPFEEDGGLQIDYKDSRLLLRFMSERGRILPRRMTGLTSANQRLVNRAIKRAQHLALLPYTRG